MWPVEWHQCYIVTLNDLEGHSPVVGLFKCNPSNICTVFYQISTDSALARSLSDSWASCLATIWPFIEILRSLVTAMQARSPFQNL